MREGWFFPGLRGAPTVVVAHGYREQRADVLTLVTALQEQQFNAFLFDFTGHGTSPGVTTLGYKETEELAIGGADTIRARRRGLRSDSGCGARTWEGTRRFGWRRRIRGLRRWQSTMPMPIRATWCKWR